MEYYVYVYLDPTKKGQFEYGELKFDYEPFYIGKGKGYRAYNSFFDFKHKNIKHSFKHKKMKKLYEKNILPITIKIFEKLSSDDAFVKEIEIIKIIGRKDKKLGPLVNSTDGGDVYSHNNDYVINKLSKPVLQYDLAGNFIKEYTSSQEAGLALGLVPIQISRVCKKHPRYNTAGSFRWEYKYPDELQKHIKDRKTKLIREKHSEETKIKMSKPKKWKTVDGKHPSKGKIVGSRIPPILQYDLDGNFIKEWPSIAVICKAFNYNYNRGYCGIYRNIKNPKRNKSCYGFIWKFKN